MSRMSIFPKASLAFCLLLLGALSPITACAPADAGATGCEQDSDCSFGQQCEVSGNLGVCQCSTDDQCAVGEYCNNFNACQIRPSCLGNQDCNDGTNGQPREICNSADANGGACIPEAQCGSSVHCEINNYCKITPPATIGECEPGCRTTGDCQLGDICLAGQCATGGCDICPANPNPDASYCDYGDTCTREVDGFACQEHTLKGGLCSRCDFEPDGRQCDIGLACIIDNDDANENYCTATCNIVSDCPNGYDSCGSLQFVGPDCGSDSDCALYGGGCLRGDESSRGNCSYGDSSYCPQLICQNNECGVEQFSFETFQNEFYGYGLPCGGTADCATVFSPFSGRTDGFCETQIQVCGKSAGSTCGDLSPGAAICNDL